MLSQKIFEKQLMKFKSKNDSYKRLWLISKKAIREKKIFNIEGNYRSVRNALMSRGWVEKLTKEQMNALKEYLISQENSPVIELLERIVLSHMVRMHPVYFFWSSRSRLRNSLFEFTPLINKIELSSLAFTNKRGLCDAIKERQWYCIENIAVVNVPRMYNSYGVDLEDFKTDFMRTACVCLMKWFVEVCQDLSENDEDIITPWSHEYEIESEVTLKFALEECEKYLNIKRHFDIDVDYDTTDIEKWKDFQNKSKILMQNTMLHPKSCIVTYLEEAKKLLEEMKQYNPEFECEGLLNIWIVKPACSSRGQGIIMESDMERVLNMISSRKDITYVIQKYIEKPLLIYDTKFDIRQYYLITDTYPLTIWVYRDCYLRFSSNPFQLKDLHESIHLTNKAIQRKYSVNEFMDQNFPTFKMWDLEQFKFYLRETGHGDIWDTQMYPEIKRNIIALMLTCQEGMVTKKKCFELYGCDFVIDSNFKPWLIEINSNPDLSASTPTTEKICNEVLQDVMQTVLDNNSRYYGTKIGNFECVYSQIITRPQIDIKLKDLVVTGERINFKKKRKKSISGGQ